MTKQKEVYKCEICGNIVEVLHVGQGELVCCGKPMVLQEEKLDDSEKSEKHVPVIVDGDDEISVKIGKIEHPMTDEHYIEWIEIVTNKTVDRRYLEIGDEPKVQFPKLKDEVKYIRTYCNLHGLWRTNYGKSD